ncbi:MAG: sugar phosphate nucleotidyltransferase [Deltaproteobacteria bacterium]
MKRFAVIMAGGSGERFWPASRRARPKQLLKLTDPELTMLEEAIVRIEPLIPRENVVVATSEILAEPIRRALPSLPPQNVLAEPEKKNTAACLALAAAFLEKEHGDPAELAMAVLTADHLIGDQDAFRATVDAALSAANQNGTLVTIGVPPTRPETGYGYVEVEDDLANAAPSLPVAAFREKPDLETAKTYLASGRHLWNSGMFFWNVGVLNEGFTKHLPQLAAARPGMIEALGGKGDLAAIFASLDDISIDYGLMERADNVAVVPANFEWDDVGSWDALARTRKPDADGNISTGEPILIDTKDCIVYNAAGGDAQAVAVIGVENLIVATTPDGVIVVPKDRAQDVKRAVAALRKAKRDQFI